MSPLDGQPFEGLHTETFEFSANIIELIEKSIVPDGIISDASIGHTSDFNEEDYTETSFKAILDFGLIDVNEGDIEAVDNDISFVGITSDMLVVDVGDNKTDAGAQKYRVGDRVKLKVNYMGVARLLNSKFIDKVYV